MTRFRRVLYVPNEIGDALQSGYRRALADLADLGVLGEVETFSLERRIRAGGDAAAHRADLVALARRLRPDLLFMQHLGATGLREREFMALTETTTTFLYQEADPYSRRLHPLPVSSRIAGRFADVVFTVGAGTFTQNFRRARARRVEWTPSVFDPARIEPYERRTEREVDVAVVANRGRARVRPLPDAAARVHFVTLMQQRHGERMGLYGRGWTGRSARGPVPYSEQTRAIRSAWISANWDHFADEACYFSDRLAVSLASGSIHATTLHPGYGAVFPGGSERFLITGSTPEDLVRRIDAYLERTSVDQRLESEAQAQRFAWNHLRQDDHLVTMLNAVGADIDPAAAREAWDLRRATPTAG